jgi:hypothetical protein
MKHGQPTGDMPHERVIRVHGTAASSPEDRGEAWWQLPIDARKHKCWRGLLDRLPPTIEADDKVFHWSGGNSECDRQVAAAELLDHLLELEAVGQGYHLVGHSHGGSVLWATLCLACERRVELQGLRSWTTVGTPFLRFRRSRLAGIRFVSVRLVLVLAVVVGVPLVLPWARDNGWLAVGFMAAVALVVLWRTFATTRKYLTCRREAYERHAAASFGALWLAVNSSEDEAINGLKSVEVVRPFLPRWKSRVAAPPWHAGVTKVPGCVPDSRRTLQPVGLTYDKETFRQSGAALLAVGLATLLVVLAISFLSEAWRSWLLQNVVMKVGPLMAKIAALLMVFLGCALVWLWNQLTLPALDQLAHGWLANRSFGNDTPSFHVHAVLTCPPVADASGECPHLPDAIDAKLIHNANRHISGLIPSVRRVLLYQATSKAPTLMENARLAGLELSGQELIHTSYFDNSDVLEIIRIHILTQSSMAVSWEGTDPDKVQWVRDFKREMNSYFGGVS